MKVTQALALLGAHREYHETYSKHLGKLYLSKQATQMHKDITAYYDEHPTHETIEWETFRDWFHIDKHPALKLAEHQMYDTLIDNIIKEGIVNPSIVDTLYSMAVAESIEQTASKLVGGDTTVSLNEIQDMLDDYDAFNSDVSLEDNFVVMDVERLIEDVMVGDGIEWRLDELNLSVGQIHPSDFIMIVKRPETGGTTFLTSEFTYMLDQLPADKDAIIFNNEEGGTRIGLRIVQSALGKTSRELHSDPIKSSAEYTTFLNGRKIHVYDRTGMDTQEIERVLAKHSNVGLIGINVLDKVNLSNTGRKNYNEVETFRKLAEWSRGIAREHGTVMAVAQADGTADDTQYINLTQLYGSKTGVQGECDVMIMIGRDTSQDHKRFFNITKNKKPQTGRMDATLRHAKFEAKFDGEKGRYG